MSDLTAGPIAVAVIGAGNMGRHHARNYAQLAAASLRAVVDADAGRSAQLARRHSCRAYSSVAELLAAEPDVEAASVAVSTSTHVEVAVELLEAGVHVLVEKPIATTVEDARSLVRAAERATRILAVGHVERFNPGVRELKRQIDAGCLGRVLSLNARRVGVMPPRTNDADVVLDLAIHDIDVARYLLDADQPDRAFCNAGAALLSDRYDFADIFLQFGEVGCLLQANWLTPVKIRSISVSGSLGYAELDYVSQELRLYPAQNGKEPESFRELERYGRAAPVVPRFKRSEPLALELAEFLRAVRTGSGDTVSGEDGTRSLAVAETLVHALTSRPELVAR